MTPNEQLCTIRSHDQNESRQAANSSHDIAVGPKWAYTITASSGTTEKKGGWLVHSNDACRVRSDADLCHNKSNCSPGCPRRPANAFMGVPTNEHMCGNWKRKSRNNQVSAEAINTTFCLCMGAKRKLRMLGKASEMTKNYLLHCRMAIETTEQNASEVTLRQTIVIMWLYWRRDDAKDGTLDSRSGEIRSVRQRD